MVEAIIFDIGGVLAFDVWENLLLDEERGIATLNNMDREFVWRIGKTLWEEFAYISPGGQSTWQSLERAYWHRFIEETNITNKVDDFIGMTDSFIKPVEGMPEFVQQLFSNGIKLAICSNNTEFWFQRQFHRLKYQQFFDPSCVILSNRIGVSKSSPKFQMFKAAVDALEVDKGACVFVDDRKSSIENAIKFGLPALLFPSHASYGNNYLEQIFREMDIL